MFRLSLILLLIPGLIPAQTPAGRVLGRVTDSSAAVIPGAEIQVTNTGTNITQTTVSNETGEYSVPYLQPGTYTLEVKSGGFRAYRRAAFPLAVDQALRIDVILEVGAASETVTVTDAPPVLNTETGARSTTITSEEITDIPLEGRNFADLALLSGGVIPKADGGDGSYAVNGGRADNTGFVLDGMNNTQRRNTGAVINPPLEGVQEFKMITSGFSAEYGRYAGGVLTAVTKSGTNRYRGSLYEFFRNDALDATGYFDVTKAKLRRNQFGATFSGPVWIPKLYSGRNRTFFLFTWESLRLTDGKTQRGIVPQPEMLRGDFSRAVDAFGRRLTIVDPLAARTPFAGNQIPASRLNPVAQKLASYFPAPNLTGGANNYIGQGNATGSNDNLGVKIDHLASPKDRLSLSAFWRPNNVFDPLVNGRSPIPVFGLTNQTLDLLSYIRYLRTLTPTMFVELSANFSRKTNNQVWPLSGERDWAAETGFVGGTTNPVAAGIPQLDAAGYIPLGPAYDVPKIWVFNNYQYAGTLTWIKGRHNLKFGADFLRMQYFSRSFGDTRGRVTFLGRFTNEPLADWMLGFPQTSRRQLDAAGPYHLVTNSSSFIQDDFKVNSRLTLNLGLRHDLMSPPREKFGAWSMFVPSLGKIVISGRGLVPDFDQRIASVRQFVTMASDVGLPATIRRNNYLNFAPRFGFAFQPFRRGTTVLRGGYGIFYGSSSLYRLDEYSDTFPFSINETYNAVTNNPLALTLSDPFPVARRNVGGVTSTAGAEAKIKDQYLQSWNFTIEHQFAKESVVEIAYAGSKGTHLPRRFDLNQQIRDLDYRAANGVFPRPYPAFATINIINDGSNSSYHSGAVTLRRRFNRQLFLRATYTFAKSLDESSNTGGTLQYNFSNAQDSQNLKLERGRSDFDIRHAFASSFIVSPYLGRNYWLKDWQIAGTATAYTGPPFTPRIANFNFVNGEASRPDRIANGAAASPTADQWFDRRAFPVVPVGSFRFGTSGRNILDGPGTFSLNTSLSRRFRLAERTSTQFRWELFNVPNHPNFNLPENRVDILSGGTINRAKPNRTMQLALRLEF